MTLPRVSSVLLVARRRAQRQFARRMKRWPRVRGRRHGPSSVAGTMSAPWSITSQCTGRTNCASPAPQRMRFGIGSASSAVLHDARQQRDRRRAGLVPLNHRYSLPLSSRSRAERFKRHAAAVGEGLRGARRCAGGVEAARTGGPRRRI
jgi:hypothetical protein